MQGEDIAQSDPNTQHVTAALEALECLVVQDLFLNETAKFAHVFLPGSSFLEKNGTFTNAERRISRVRKVMPPLAGLADWEVTVALANALGYPMHYDHPSQIMDEIARLTPTFTGVSFDEDRSARQHPVAVQRQGAGRHAGDARRGVRARQGQVRPHRVRAHRRAHDRSSIRCILTTGRILSASTTSARRPGAQRTRCGTTRTVSRSTRTMRSSAASRRATGSAFAAGRARPCCAPLSRSACSQAWCTRRSTTRVSGANVITTENSDWATNCPEYKVTAVQVSRVAQPSEWQRHFTEFDRRQHELLPTHEAAKA